MILLQVTNGYFHVNSVCMKDELSFRGWQISLQLKLLKFAKKIFFLVLEFIQLSFLSSEIDVKTVPVSLIFFFVVGKRFFFFFFFFFFYQGVDENSEKLYLPDKAVW